MYEPCEMVVLKIEKENEFRPYNIFCLKKSSLTSVRIEKGRLKLI